MPSHVGIKIVVLWTSLASAAFGQTSAPAFGPSNPFYAESTLPFHAPPFDRIHDTDYQPAIEAGIAAEAKEVQAIADNPASPDFANTIVALSRSGRLLRRVEASFNAVTSANTNRDLQKIETEETPRLSALEDSTNLNTKLFARIRSIYDRRSSLSLDPESARLLELTFRRFTHAGANLDDADKARLKEINSQLSILSNTFNQRLLSGTKSAAYATTDPKCLAGLPAGRIGAAAAAANSRNQPGYVLPLINTTQQPVLATLTDRATRAAVFNASWTRTERGDQSDTRDTIVHIVKLRAEKAKLLGVPNFASWKLADQMAKNPEAVQKFLDALVPPATASARAEAKDIQDVIDAQHGGFQLAAYDWDLYAEQVRKAKYDLDEAAVRPYFELNRVLTDGVFYAATKMYGITFRERKDIPVYQPDVRVFEVTDADGKPLALFYCDYYKRDNKEGGAWSTSFVGQSKLLGTLPAVSNVANLPSPHPASPRSSAPTMFELCFTSLATLSMPCS